ncbi:MAG: hypothetical protein ABII79_03235 [bacterium]
MRLRALGIVALTLALVISRSDKLCADDFDIRAGVGYDLISQRFFLDSLEGTDSLLSSWASSADYLDDLKGQFAVTWWPGSDRRTELAAGYEQTAEFIRLRLSNRSRLTLGHTRLDLDGEMEQRQRHRGTADFGDTYLSGALRAKLTTPVSKTTSLGFQVRGDGVSFRRPADYSYNYSRVGGRVSMTKSLAGFSFVDTRLFVTTRQVPDSLPLNYVNAGVESSLFGFFGDVELDLFVRLEKKDYNKPSGKDDYTRFETNARSKIDLGADWFGRPETEIELTRYSSTDPINADYNRVGLALMFGREFDGLTIAAGPDLEFHEEQMTDLLNPGDFTEKGVRVDFDYMSFDRLFCSIESVTGFRDLTYDDDWQSDFTFQRLNLITDTKMLSSVSLSVLFSAEWEWHPQERSQVYLLSSSLNYSF